MSVNILKVQWAGATARPVSVFVSELFVCICSLGCSAVFTAGAINWHFFFCWGRGSNLSYHCFRLSCQ
jgi:hypothetical protein